MFEWSIEHRHRYAAGTARSPVNVPKLKHPLPASASKGRKISAVPPLFHLRGRADPAYRSDNISSVSFARGQLCRWMTLILNQAPKQPSADTISLRSLSPWTLFSVECFLAYSSSSTPYMHFWFIYNSISKIRVIFKRKLAYFYAKSYFFHTIST